MINAPSKNKPGRSLSDSILSVGPVRSMALSLIHHPLLMGHFVLCRQPDMFPTQVPFKCKKTTQQDRFH